MKQQTLPGFEHVPIFNEDDYPSDVIFFYLVSPCGKWTVTMLGGSMVRTENDLQHVVPHLFNSIASARGMAKRAGWKGWTAKKYPYEFGWWDIRS